MHGDKGIEKRVNPTSLDLSASGSLQLHILNAFRVVSFGQPDRELVQLVGEFR